MKQFIVLLLCLVCLASFAQAQTTTEPEKITITADESTQAKSLTDSVIAAQKALQDAVAAARKTLQDAVNQLQTFRASLQSNYLFGNAADGVAVQTQSGVPIYLKTGWDSGFRFSTDFTQIVALPQQQGPRRQTY